MHRVAAGADRADASTGLLLLLGYALVQVTLPVAAWDTAARHTASIHNLRKPAQDNKRRFDVKVS